MVRIRFSHCRRKEYGIESLSIRQEGTRVKLIKDGQLILDLPYQAALELGIGLRVKGKRARQEATVENVITDQAIMMQAGVPLNISGHQPKIFKEAANRLPGAGHISSKCVVGRPSVVHSRPDDQTGR